MNEPEDNALETCATHGRLYDPLKATGCPLCQRLEPTAANRVPSLSVRSLVPWVLLVTLGMLGVHTVGKLRGIQISDELEQRVPQPELGPVPHVAVTDGPLRVSPLANDKPGCVEGTAHWEEDCNTRCQVRDFMCRSTCLGLLDPRLWRCNVKLTTEPGEIYAIGPAPSAVVLHAAVMAALPKWQQCEPANPGITMIHLTIDGVTGRAKSVGVNAAGRSDDPCVERALASGTYPTAASGHADYAFLSPIEPPWVKRSAVVR